VHADSLTLIVDTSYSHTPCQASGKWNFRLFSASTDDIWLYDKNKRFVYKSGTSRPDIMRIMSGFYAKSVRFCCEFCPFQNRILSASYAAAVRWRIEHCPFFMRLYDPNDCVMRFSRTFRLSVYENPPPAAGINIPCSGFRNSLSSHTFTA